MLLFKNRWFLILPFLWSLSLLQAQGNSAAAVGGDISFANDKTDPVSFIGMKLEELIKRFGSPLLVYPARGLEEWQDDVVFVYEQADFYIYKDRIWQAGLKEAAGIKLGDSKSVVLLVLGTGRELQPSVSAAGSEIRGDSLFYFLNDGAWPLELRIDFDDAGKVKAIFIYRTDF